MKGSGPAAPAGREMALAKSQTAAVARVMQGVVAMRRQVEKELSATSGRAPTLEALGITNVTEVRERDPSAVMRAIEELFADAADSILRGQGLHFEVPNRTATNQLYVPELDRIVLKSKTSTRSFDSTAQVRKTAIMTRVMEMLHQVLRRNIHTTKRDLFYADVKLFRSQDESDAVLDDVACVIGCTRTSLHVVASEKGVVVGRVQFREDGDLIDCTRMGVGGKAIPPFIDKISDFRSDAEFILLVEKDAAFMRLAEDRFYNKYPCIIITAKGQPDVATRLFLRKCRDDLKLPVLGLVDADPYGLKILSVYMSGSKTMSYDSASLTTSDIKWLGVRPSDLDKYNIPEQCRLPMKASDIKYGKALLEEDFVRRNPKWYAELEAMLSSKVKAEIQALSSYGFQYLTETYLPRKLKERDWI
ncbi:hypothetical protein FNF28_00989 [Cafeteria roenbergensis]|uniref:DNA topoisomerase (ATP-hydrolyzing) n=2 Tax=Cafeteria roenbergensis TaxID=33653 RepID=A0A5A8E2N2_CAFRO|nr:hypothetical protein FNF28_00989 [Cafeteria roenbergensis]